MYSIPIVVYIYICVKYMTIDIYKVYIVVSLIYILMKLPALNKLKYILKYINIYTQNFHY